MGQVLHGSATTTEAVRRAIQAREESVRALACRYGISPTTVQKWRKRETVADERMGPKQVRSTVLSLEEEAVIIAFRRHTLLRARPVPIRSSASSIFFASATISPWRKPTARSSSIPAMRTTMPIEVPF
jgi:transposase-like protein